MNAFRPLWVALRAAVLATAVFWVALFIVDKIGWQAPLGMTEQMIFFVIFFLGVLMVDKK
ncbi:MAG: hypothetical protein Q8K93_07195 [Reyranella sp.]|uniref:hypothetical protein n=1 Tax=Reyranella sp. TaxID=1929291 RepID=UPI00273208A9|nr:hypothetical protein [Reyranella sp.]MDP1961970.1 hypothetical protein [Reyranella sp.]MDP2378014.1 hypothetical protein [Reyranella sp.]